MSFLVGFSEKAYCKCSSEAPLQQKSGSSDFGYSRHRKSDTRNLEKQQNHCRVGWNHNSAEKEKSLNIDAPNSGKIRFWSHCWGPGGIQITQKTMLWKVFFEWFIGVENGGGSAAEVWPIWLEKSGELNDNFITPCSPKGVRQITGFASAADLSFSFVYDYSIDLNCFPNWFVALNRSSIDLHWILEMFVDCHFFVYLSRFSKMLLIF